MECVLTRATNFRFSKVQVVISSQLMLVLVACRFRVAAVVVLGLRL